MNKFPHTAHLVFSSTHTLYKLAFRILSAHCVCGCAHSERRRCGRLNYRECAVSVRTGKYQVCGMQKFVQLKKPKIYLYLKQKPSNVLYEVLIKFYDQFRCELTPRLYIII